MGLVTDDARASLVPQLAIELASEPGHRHVLVDGSMLSADISGFTALSERLADKGKAGAEEITSLISKCFEALIDTAYDYGGEVLKFGGDALLVIFRGDDHKRRTAAASAAMQIALANSRAAKQAKLTMTVGASEGPFDVFMVGTETRDLLISGDRATKVIELEGTADKGCTLISAGIAESLNGEIPLEDHELGFNIVEVVDAPKTGPRTATNDPDIVRTLISPPVNRHFAAFAQLGGEHRIVAVDFLSIGGLQHQLDTVGGQATAELLGHIMDSVHTIAERFDVSVLHTDIYDDGVKFLMCAGAPHTTGQTSDAILEAALEIQKIETPFSLKQGIQSGRCFAGFLGSEHRRAYTLMGDIVNTAARMLGPAHDRDIVAVDDVFTTTRTVFVTDPLPPVQAKGKTEPIAASRVISTSDTTRFTRKGTPLIGREAQLAQLTTILDSPGGIAEISGPAGAGKSRLLEAITDLAVENGNYVERSHCSPYSQASPYSTVRVLLRRTLGIDTFADTETAGDVLLKVIEKLAPELKPFAPVLAVPLSATVENTPESDAIDPKFLRSQIHLHVHNLLLKALPAQSVVVVEDIHWIDEPSAEFLDYLFAQDNDSEWTTILTRRPSGTWEVEPGDESFEQIVVEPLTADDVRELAIVSAETHLTDRQLDAVVEQAEGNPLFAIELAKAVGTSETLPDSVEQLIGARVDRLNPAERHAMRVASVFGYRLRQVSLRTVLAPLPLPPLQNLEEFLTVAPNGDINFTHALYRDVSYEGLPFAERKRLHRSVGEHLESTVDDPTPLADLLALHFSEAKDSARTWTYGVMAGDAATAKTAPAEAAESYRRALDVAPRVQSLSEDDIFRVALALGDANSLSGHLDRAENAFRRARSRSNNSLNEATAMLRVGSLRENEGKYSDAARWYTRVADLLPEESTSDDERRVRSRMHFLQSGLRHRKNDQQGCIREARLALGEAEDANDVEAMAEALQRLHLATVYLGRKDRIEYGPRALEMFTSLNRFERLFAVHNNLGIEAYFNGDWQRAAESYASATDSAQRAGYTIGAMLGAANTAEILGDQGHWDEAIEILESARRNLASVNYAMGLALIKLFLGINHARRGDSEVAIALLDEATAELDALGLDEQRADAVARKLEFQVLSGTHIDEPTQRAIEQELTKAPASVSPRLHRILAMVKTKLGEPWASTREQLIEQLTEVAGYDRALTLNVLKRYDGPNADPSWASESKKILDSLGVVRLRPLPDPPD